MEAVSGIRARLGRGAPALRRLENDAKLGSVAEYLEASAAGIHDLIYVTGETGVGGGIISGGRLHRGASGFAGEIGHMPLDPGGALCACGRRGCWETMVGLTALLRHAAGPGDPVHDPSLDLEARLTDLQARAAAGDARTLEALDRVADGLGLGLALLADVLNPRAVVLGGYFTYFGDRLAPRVERLMAERVMAPDTGGCRLLLSTLGFTAPARGGALLALDPVYEDPAQTVATATGPESPTPGPAGPAPGDPRPPPRRGRDPQPRPGRHRWVLTPLRSRTAGPEGPRRAPRPRPGSRWRPAVRVPATRTTARAGPAAAAATSTASAVGHGRRPARPRTPCTH
ncbi:ROK family protein [Streptomyces sp. NBC_01244]|nr:ROK family protein [Streptomyces sp. NBC_01244]